MKGVVTGEDFRFCCFACVIEIDRNVSFSTYELSVIIVG